MANARPKAREEGEAGEEHRMKLNPKLTAQGQEEVKDEGEAKEEGEAMSRYNKEAQWGKSQTMTVLKSARQQTSLTQEKSKHRKPRDQPLRL